jgi:signal transduction histidine kinase
LVWADRDRVFQVILNLLGNAIKFTPEGGTIVLSAERRDADVLFTVTDTGPGISAEDLAHIFDRYWRKPASRIGGSGLGLSIAKGIVEAHGGRIWAESVPGAGSRFYFVLPSNAATAVDGRPSV